jgi:hypothetical protein
MIFIPTAVPEALTADANQLAMVWGEGPADAQTWGDALFQDEAGNRYTVRHLWATENWIHRVKEDEPVNPEWDTEGIVDLAAAERAREALDVLTYDADADPAQYRAKLNRSIAIVGIEGDAALALMGLSMVDHDKERQAT